MAIGNRPVAIITGASRGLGMTLAHFLAGRGYDLVLNGRNGDALVQAAEKIMSVYDVGISSVAGDITDAETRRLLVSRVSQWGHLAVLVNNASDLGVSPLPPLWEYPVAALESVYRVNVFAPLQLIQDALPLLRKSSGLVVNISSDAAVGGYEGWGGYGSSKAALDLLSLTLANELRADGVSVVSVDPGDMRTDMHQLAFPGQDISDRPMPDVTIPFWAWLFGQTPAAVSGGRYAAQASRWEAAHEAV